MNSVVVEGHNGEAEPLCGRAADELARVFAALGEPSRLRIIHALASGERSVSVLAGSVGLAVPAVSQHLRILREVRLVRNRREGKMMYYALDDAHVADLYSRALAHVQGGD